MNRLDDDPSGDAINAAINDKYSRDLAIADFFKALTRLVRLCELPLKVTVEELVAAHRNHRPPRK